MTKLRISALATAIVVVLLGAGSALASSGGNSNAGDVWLDNVGQPSGPGHEMDPHLACQDINLWGAKLADTSGTFTISGWPPSGSKQIDYSGNWSYNPSQGGDQVVATISVATLIGNASANGDRAAHNGYHFKLDFGQDPQKHKTFWVDCTSVPSSSTTSSSERHTTRHTGSTGSTGSTRSTHSTHSTRRTRAGHHSRQRSTRRTVRRRRISRRPRKTRGFTG